MGMKPLFNSAPRIKLRIGDKTIAFAIGLNLSVSVDIVPIQVMGQFGPVSLEPTMYQPVTGTLQIQKLLSSKGRQNLKDTVEGVGNQEFTQYSVLPETETPTLLDESNWTASNTIYTHLDPTKVLASETFTIDLYLSVPTLEKKQNADKQVFYSTSFEEKPWMRVSDVRLISRNVNISLGQIVNEPVSFQGLLLTPYVPTDGEDFTFKKDVGPSQTN